TLGTADDNILSLAFAPHSGVLAFGCQDGRVLLWDIVNDRAIVSVAGKEDPNLLSFSIDSKLLCITCSDGTCQLASPIQGSVVHDLSGATAPFSCGLFSPYGPYFLMAASPGLLSRWDALSFQQHIQEMTPLHDVVSCAVSRCTPSFAARSSTGLVVVWD